MVDHVLIRPLSKLHRFIEAGAWGSGGGHAGPRTCTVVRPVIELHRFIAVVGGGGWGWGVGEVVHV